VPRVRECAPTPFLSAIFYLGFILKSFKELGSRQRSFIGLCNYYRIYVQDFNTISHPFYALLKKDVVWTWSEEAQEAFNTLKEKLSKFSILRKPDFDKVFILHTNWNALSIGVILSQLDEEGKEYVIAYAS
jgi:hypothetical protein